jgi:hypothetical protein
LSVDDAGTTEPADIASIVTVDQIAVYQGVKVTLVEEASVATSNVPVVPGRPALVRVHARPLPGKKVSRLTAELRLHVPGRDDVVLVDGPRTLTPAVDEGVLSSTFDFELSAEQIKRSASLSVELRDPKGVDPSTVRFPQEGTLPMNVGPLAPTLKVRFVPIRYDADGSGRLPALDPQTIEAYRKALYKLYPVAEVDVSVREPFNWPLLVQPDGDGWDQLLQAVVATREADQPADDVYYVGIFTPAPTEREYCKTGCVLGVAPWGLKSDIGLRAAMVVGYPSERSHGTMAQEIAHAMGRAHAPCGQPAAIDKKFPYPGGSLGVWGWDVVDHQLVNPDERVYDFMSYCEPVWVSDYTFKGLYERMIDVDGAKALDFERHRPVKVYSVAKDGSMRPGPTIRVLASTVSAPAMDSFVLENAAHQPVGKVRGVFRPTSGIGGGLLLVPEDVPTATIKSARFARALTTKS